MSTSLDALIHAVLDGEASAAQRAELDRRIETEPAVRARFEEVQRVFTMLEAPPPVWSNRFWAARSCVKTGPKFPTNLWHGPT